MPLPPRTLPLLSLIALLAWSLPVTAQVRHCVTPDGQHIFTDRECAAMGGVEQVQPRQPVAAATQARRSGCARNIDDLVFEMTSAFDTHDANRLAGVYHWTGMSGTSAYDVMARLDALVQRPLVDIVPVMPEAEPVTDPQPGIAASSDASFETPGNASLSLPEPAESAPPTRRQQPVALRIEQTLANGVTPARTVFGLQKHFGCWWIKG